MGRSLDRRLEQLERLIHVGTAEPDAHVEREWTVDEEGVVDEPSDRSGPDFNEDLDPTDAP